MGGYKRIFVSLIISQPRQTRLAGQRGRRGGSGEKLGWAVRQGVSALGGGGYL